MGKKIVIILVACFPLFSFLEPRMPAKENINWLSIEEVKIKMKSEPKPVLIDLYTNWCYWCKVMDKKTYSNTKVIRYINKNFYAIKLNAETKDTIRWADKNYTYDKENKVNDFSIYVTNGQLSFPNTIIFPDIQKVPASIPGFMEPKDAELILTYFGNNAYKTMNFDEYAKNFKSTW